MINIITYDNVNNKIYSRMNLIEKHAKKYICGRLVYNFLIFSEIDKALDFNEYVSANIVLNLYVLPSAAYMRRNAKILILI